MIDGGHGYQGLRYHYNSHGVVGEKHSNTVENFFSIFKRRVIGTYHHMSKAHLGRYPCRV